MKSRLRFARAILECQLAANAGRSIATLHSGVSKAPLSRDETFTA
jgi:hypothetical protein